MKIYKLNNVGMITNMLLIALQFYFLLVYADIIEIKSWENLYIPICMSIIFSIILIKKDKMILKFGTNIMVYIYMIISLFALILLIPFFPSVIEIRSAKTMSFLEYHEMIKAISIAAIGCIIFITSTSFFSRIALNKNEKAKSIIGNGISDIREINKEGVIEITFLAECLLVYCIIYFGAFILKNISLLSQGYNSSTQINNGLYNNTVAIMAVSLPMLMTVANKKHIKIGIVLFFILTIFQFLLGNRGEVLYPILATIAVYTKRGGTFKKRFLIAAIVILLILISSIRIIRTVGVFSENKVNIFEETSVINAIVESLGEMGFQIGTIVYLLRYLNLGGTLQYGATIIYSFQNFLGRNIPFIPIPDLSSPAAIKTIMPTDYYAFTNIGEFYYNFGIIGVYIGSIILAGYLVKISKFSKDMYFELFNNMFFVSMIIWVRNASTTIPMYMFWSIVLTGIALILSKIKMKGKKYD